MIGLPPAFKDGFIFPKVCAFAFSEVRDELAFISVSVGPEVNAYSHFGVVGPFAVVVFVKGFHTSVTFFAAVQPAAIVLAARNISVGA
jgi:hypothetical protein